MAIRHELLDELLKKCKKLEDILGEGGILKEQTKGGSYRIRVKTCKIALKGSFFRQLLARK